MTDPFDNLLRRTLDDGRLTRTERRELTRVLEGVDLHQGVHAAYLRRGFELAAEALERHSEQEVLDWLLTFAKTLVAAHERQPASGMADVLFEPRDDCGARLRELVDATSRSLWICVFTITDDRLARPVIEAHRRGVDVRIITDIDKSYDAGSDIRRFAAAGLPVRWDRVANHMHHKFAVFDGRLAVTGSYNWTRGAAEMNLENLLVTDDPRLIGAFVEEFERLWSALESEI